MNWDQAIPNDLAQYQQMSIHLPQCKPAYPSFKTSMTKAQASVGSVEVGLVEAIFCESSARSSASGSAGMR